MNSIKEAHIAKITAAIQKFTDDLIAQGPEACRQHLESIGAIGVNENTRETVELNLSVEEFILLAKQAHEHDMSINRYIEWLLINLHSESMNTESNPEDID